MVNNFRKYPGRTPYTGDGDDMFDETADAMKTVAVASTASAGTVAVSNTETIETELIAAASVAASLQIVSSTLSVVGVKRGTFIIDHAKANTAAFTTNGPEYRIEVSAESANNDTWRPIASLVAGSAVAASAAASSDVAIGTSLVKITSGTAMVLGDIICFTSGTIEWTRATAVTGTASFNVQDATRFDHASDTGIFGGGEHFVVSADLEAVTRVRVIVNNNNSSGTQPIVARAALITSL